MAFEILTLTYEMRKKTKFFQSNMTHLEHKIMIHFPNHLDVVTYDHIKITLSAQMSFFFLSYVY